MVLEIRKSVGLTVHTSEDGTRWCRDSEIQAFGDVEIR